MSTSVKTHTAVHLIRNAKLKHLTALQRAKLCSNSKHMESLYEVIEKSCSSHAGVAHTSRRVVTTISLADWERHYTRAWIHAMRLQRLVHQNRGKPVDQRHLTIWRMNAIRTYSLRLGLHTISTDVFLFSWLSLSMCADVGWGRYAYLSSFSRRWWCSWYVIYCGFDEFCG